MKKPTPHSLSLARSNAGNIYHEKHSKNPSLFNMGHPSGSTVSVLENFSTFYESWLAHQEIIHEQLLVAVEPSAKEERQLGLIKQAMAHYQQYYDEQNRAAGEDVFRAFSAPWLSSYERALLWISGFKPSMVFILLAGAVHDLSATQGQRMQELKADVRRKERQLTEAMASLQETVAAPPIVGLARRAGRRMDGEISDMDDAMEELKLAMWELMERADMVRGSMMKKVMEILSPEQTVKLLAAAAEFQLRIRSWGVEKDLQRTGGSI